MRLIPPAVNLPPQGMKLLDDRLLDLAQIVENVPVDIEVGFDQLVGGQRHPLRQRNVAFPTVAVARSER
jgi:hypothetical protein